MVDNLSLSFASCILPFRPIIPTQKSYFETFTRSDTRWDTKGGKLVFWTRVLTDFKS